MARHPRSVHEDTLAMVLDDLRLLIVLLAPDGTITWANRAALALGGRSLKEIVGEPLLAGPWWSASAVRAGVEAALARAIAGEATYFEADLGPDPDHLHRYALTLRPLSTRTAEARILVKGSDITEARHREDREDAQYRAVVDTQTEVISRIAADGTLRFVNDAYCRLFGRSREALLGRRWHPMAHPDDVPRIEREIKRLTPEEPVVVIENRVFDADGRFRWLEFVNRGFFDADGSLVEIQSIGRDVTLRREGEAERQLAERRLQERQRREGLGLIAGGVAHDFNNVLACITASIALARINIAAPDEVARYHEEIEDAATRGAMLCRQMLAYAGKSPLAPRPLDLDALIRSSEPLFRASLPVGATLRFHLDPALPAVLGDETQLRQIFLNLVGNAGEALREPGTVTVSTRRAQVVGGRLDGVELDGELAHGEVVVVAVRDTGVGIPPDVRARIFEPFFSTKATGRGLGLAATAGLVRAHGAAIRVESAPGMGALFEVVFPAARDGSEPAVPAHPRPVLAARPRGEGRVLIVDDDDALRRLLARQLTALGYDVLAAGSGTEALALFHRHAGEVRLALVDMTMPDMNGDLVVHGFRSLRPDVPILVMSGYSTRSVRELFAGHRNLGFLQKPFILEQLQDTLAQLDGVDPS